MNLTYCLNKEIPCEKICKDISSLLSNYQKNNIDKSEAVLVISLQKIQEHIPRLVSPNDAGLI